MKKTFNRFTDITHRPLRIYNRAVMTFNIMEDQGKETAAEYLDSFTKEVRLEIAQMTALTRKIGPKQVKEMVTRNIDFVDDEYVE